MEKKCLFESVQQFESSVSFAGYTVFTAQTARILEDAGDQTEASIATLLVQLSQVMPNIISS